MATTSYVFDLVPSTGSIGPGPAIELPGPKKDFGIYVTEAVSGCSVDIQASPDGVTWTTITTVGGSVPNSLAIQNYPTIFMRGNVTAVSGGTVAIKVVVAS